MDFLLSFRLSQSQKEEEPTNQIKGKSHDLRVTAFSTFLLLSVSNALWKFCQIVGVFFRFLITTYSISFLEYKVDWNSYHYFVLVLDVFFVVNLFSAVLYRCTWPNNKRIMRESSPQLAKLAWRNVAYKPTPIWMLVIDVISVIPFYVILQWVSINKEWYPLVRCGPLLRIYKIFVFYKDSSMNVAPETHIILKIFTKFTIFWLLLSHSIACFWRLFAWHTKSKIIDNIRASKFFHYDEPFSWYWMLFYFVEINLTNNGFGDVTPTTDLERAFVAVFCIIGFIVLNGYLISALSAVLTEQVRRVTILRFRIYLMEYELEQRKVPQAVVSKVLKFYHSLWNSRSGVGPRNEMLISLPASLSGQVYFDIFSPALNAVSVYLGYYTRSCDEISKREIAKVMQTDLYMAGDVILKRNEIISKMFYIRKGTVQIMSYQDDETQIMTFGSGSVFGQIALLLSIPAKSEVHAATFCEIHSITRKQLFLVLGDYPGASEKVRSVHKNMLMNVLADKFKTRSGKPPEASENVLTMNAFYKVPQQASKLSRGDICAVNTCPYVFEPDTVYLNTWSAFLALLIVGISVYYPYCAVFTREYPQNAEPFIILIDIFLLLNLYLSFATAYMKENVLFSCPRDLVVTKLTKFSVYVDVISLLPLHYCINQEIREKPIILCLRCLQFYKLHFLFLKAEYSVHVRMVGVLRLVKYVLYFFYGGYVMGMVYYLQACYTDPCSPDSWYKQSEAPQNMDSPIWVSLYFAILVMSGTGYGDITAYNERDVSFAIACCLGGVFLFIYLIAEYSANLSLSREHRQNFMALTRVVKSFLTSHKVLPSEKIRARQYLNLQWERNKGYEFTSNNSLFYDTPQHLLTEISQYTRSRALQNLRLFKDISDATLGQILTQCSRNVFPPHEVVIYAGDVCDSLIVVEEGYCEVTYGNDISQKKIITVGDEIGTVELLLGMTSLCHVRTITHCSILKVQKVLLFRALSHNFMAVKEFQELIEEFEKSPVLEKIKEKQTIRLHLVVQPPATKSVYRFIFFRKQGTSELRRPFLRLGLCQWIRFLIGRMTILPYGKFLKIWELSRCVFAFLSAMIFPLLPYLECEIKYLYYIGHILDVTAWIDLYFRLHVCFHNRKNLLVSHPLNTAVHYIRGSFILDFTFCFPFDRIMYRPVYDSAGFALVTTWPINFLRLLRVGQVYRIPATVLRLGKDFLSTPSLFRVMIMMIALTLVFLNLMTSAIVLLCVNYKSSKDGQYEIYVEEAFKSHVKSIESTFEISGDPVNMFFVNFYWMCVTSFGLGFGDITAGCNELMICIIVVIIFSYLYFNYVTITVASHLSSINVNLTIFQKRMTQLIKYLKAENVEQMLRKHIINHFEYVWKTNKGMKAELVFASFNPTLRNDIMVYLYEDTLKGVPAFAKMDPSFFRLLSNNLSETIFQVGAGLYKQGEIISDFYIVHQGEITLVGEHENDTVVLGPSKIFGHMDNTPRGMIKNSAVATKNVTILIIRTTALYKLLWDIQGKGSEHHEKKTLEFREALASSNTIDSDLQKKSFKSTVQGFSIVRLTYRLSTYIVMGYVILSLFSVNEVVYTLAFQSYSTELLCVIVPVEFLFIFKILIGFMTGYVDEAGDFISSYRLIRARYMRLSGFYLDFFTVVPFEILGLAFPKNEQALAFSWFRITKVLRIFHISHFFSMKLDTLNVNMVLFKIVAVAIWTGTLVHCCTCIWFLISCYGAHCDESQTWKNILEGDYHNVYVSAMYFIVVVFTATGFGDILPHYGLEIIVTEVLMFVAFFYTAVFIGQIMSTTQKTLYAKRNYDFEVQSMKTFFHVNDVPVKTQDMIFRYVRNLWRNETGSQIPTLLKTGPSYLIHEVKASTYGHHINQNPVFKICNQFFKRQLIFALKRTVYFSGDIIVFEGQIDRTVYFVHSGLVRGKPSDSSNPPKAYEMNTFFGLKQGVSSREPHKMTYTAQTYCEILSLQLKRWSFLTEFFPEDMEHVKKVAEEREWD